MKKISTLFLKDPTNLSRVIDEIDPSNQWVLTHGIATRKYDGTACAIINNELYKRYDVKNSKRVPDGAIPCQEADTITGHHPHWVKVTSSDKYHLEGLANSKHLDLSDGTYELVGPKVQSNPDKFSQHTLVPHGTYVLTDLLDLSFDGIREYLINHQYEGIVFHHKNTLTDGRMCKIRRKDFDLKWPV
jgi:hypothetical protein